MCDRKKENHNRSTLIQNSKLEASQQQPQSNGQQRLFPSVMQWLKNITFFAVMGNYHIILTNKQEIRAQP